MISQGDVELSVISKNFFFTFFNFFIIFTTLGTASGFVDMFHKFGQQLSKTSEIANALALSLQRLLTFYVNFIILQAFGLFPLRLMELGALTLYPINLIGSKTPRGELHVWSELYVNSTKQLQITQSWSSHLSSAMDSSYPRLC